MDYSNTWTSRTVGFARALLLAAVVCVPSVANAQDGAISGTA